MQSNSEAKKVLILSGGNVGQEFLTEFLATHSCDRILCVDGGLRHAYERKLTITNIVGDFDTIEPEILNYYKEHSEAEIREFNPVKDNTDSDIALELALSWNPEVIYILGATGSRMDHTIGNIHILKKALDTRTRTYLVDEHNRIFMTDKSISLKRKNVFGNYISLIPFTEKIENVTLKGFKYPLEHRTMVFGETLGISNEIVEETAEVIFDTGILLVIEAKD